MVKNAWAVWKGGIKDGGGTISTETGSFGRRPIDSRRASRTAMAPTRKS